MTSPMRTRAIFERKVGLFPKDLNTLTKAGTIETLLLNKVKETLEGRCSQHGWVIPGTLKILSRSMCQNESGRFTGAMVSWVQVEGDVYYPSDDMEIIGEVLKKNKMGLFVTYENAIQIMVPRDLHLGNEEYESVEIGAYVSIKIKKSRFQINDPYILSVGEFIRIAEAPTPPPAVRVETAAPVDAAPVPPVQAQALATVASVAAVPVVADEEGKEENEEAGDEGLDEGILGVGEAAPVAATGSKIGDFF